MQNDVAVVIRVGHNAKLSCIGHVPTTVISNMGHCGIESDITSPDGSIKGGYYDHFWTHRSKWSFWYHMKTPIFLITLVKFYVQQMVLVKGISENVAKVR